MRGEFSTGHERRTVFLRTKHEECCERYEDGFRLAAEINPSKYRVYAVI